MEVGNAPSEAFTETPATQAAAPVRVRYKAPFVVYRCKECGERFTTRRSDKLFCGPDCHRRYWTVARYRGAQVYELLCKLRRNRKVKGGTRGVLNEISHIVDEWLIADREKHK